MKISSRIHATESSSNTYTIFEDLNSREIYAFLKCNIHANMRLYDPIKEKNVCIIELRERTVGTNDQQVVMTSKNGEVKRPKAPKYGPDDIRPVKPAVLNYSNILKFIPRTYDEILDEIQPELVLTFEVNETTYQKKKPLLSILGDIKSALVDSCVNIDYREDCFVIVNKPSPKGSDKLFYWEETKNLLMFSEDDVILIKDSKYQNVEQLLCGE